MSDLARRSRFGPTGASRPDWFITGFQQEGMFVVLGSRSLQEASLEVNYELEYDPFDYGMVLARGITSGQYTFTAITRKTRPQLHEEGEVLAMAWSEKDYGEALRRLFDVWSPGGNPLSIGPGG